jgi:hypothetical protein
VEIALEAAALDVAGGDDPRSRGGELLDPGVELVVQTVDLRLLRLPFGDVRVSNHVAEDPAGCVSDWGSGDRDGDERSVIPQAHGLVVVHPLARQHPREQVLRFRALRRRGHRESATTKHLLA